MLLTNQKENKRREEKEMVGRMCKEHRCDWVRVQESKGWEKTREEKWDYIAMSEWDYMRVKAETQQEKRREE